MIRKLRFVVLLFILAGFIHNVEAQCFSYSKKVCKNKLGEYLHDGNFNATVLTEGESAEIYKTFFSGVEYRVVVCKVDSLPPVYFKILDVNNNILFDSKTQGGTEYWDFVLETTQQLIVFVEVSGKDPDSDLKISGCVSILFGIKK